MNYPKPDIFHYEPIKAPISYISVPGYKFSLEQVFPFRNLNCATVIIGGKGVGKTKLIKEQIIPGLEKKYVVFDPNNEYPPSEFDKASIHQVPYLDRYALLSKFLIKQKHHNRIAIIEDTFACFSEEDIVSFLNLSSSVIMVFQSIRLFNRLKVPEFSLPKVILFPTIDNKQIRDKFISESGFEIQQMPITTN